MKRLIVILFALMTGCAPEVSQQIQRDLQQTTVDVKRIQLEQQSMSQNGATPDEILEMVSKAQAKNRQINVICYNANLKGSLWNWCMGHQRLTAPVIAQMELTAAQSYAAAGAKDTAKSMYREIVLNHPEPYWASLRQAAEYGLQDLEK